MFYFPSKQWNILSDWISTTVPSGFSHLQLIKIQSLFSAHHHERPAPFPKISPVSLWRLWGLQIDFCSDFPAGIYSGLLLLKKQNKTKTTCFSFQRTAHLAFGTLPLTSGRLSSWNPAWWNVLCSSNFWSIQGTNLFLWKHVSWRQGWEKDEAIFLKADWFSLSETVPSKGRCVIPSISSSPTRFLGWKLSAEFSHEQLNNKTWTISLRRKTFNKLVTRFLSCLRTYGLQSQQHHHLNVTPNLKGQTGMASGHHGLRISFGRICG